ncbi:MAG: PAS domain S-box protein [Candidatus Marinimicrobia bacterium]|nr:PAS domain S-box protein [Candidatus Neomarinimicrobiota bacterium]
MSDKPTYTECEQRILELERAVTEHKQAEEKCKESEEKYRLIVENANDGIEITQDDKIIFSNTRFAEMLGYTVSEIENTVFNKIYTGQALKDLHIRNKKRELSEVVPINYETTLCKKDGTLINVDVKYEIIDYQGEPATFAIIRDITERKQTEKALRESEENYKITLKNLQVGVVVHSKDGNVLFSNPEASQLLGLTDEQMLGKELITPSWNFVHEDLSIMKVEDYPVSRVITTEQKLDFYQVGIQTKGRNYITWVIVNANPVFSDNELDKIIVNFVDITEHKQAEKELLDLKNSLEEKVKEQTKDLEEKVDHLQRFHDATIKRELRIKELRDEIDQLKEKYGEK